MPNDTRYIGISLDRYALGCKDNIEAPQHCADGIRRMLSAKYPTTDIAVILDPRRDHLGHSFGYRNVDSQEVQIVANRAIAMWADLSWW